MSTDIKSLVKRYTKFFSRQPELAPDKPMSEVQATYDSNISYAKDLLDKGKLTPENYQSFVEEEQGMVQDWKDRKKKQVSSIPFKKKDEDQKKYEKLFEKVKQKSEKEYANIDNDTLVQRFSNNIAGLPPNADNVTFNSGTGQYTGSYIRNKEEVKKSGGLLQKRDFEPHKMYKDGKAVMANTYQEHLSLGEKGYDHSAVPFKMVPETPLFGKISEPCKAAAKKKFDVWPSAYASGWGVRCTKAGGPSKMGKKKK